MAGYDQFFSELFRDYERVTLPVFGRIAAQSKSDGSSVTAADRDASALVLAALKRQTPEIGVISEEEAEPHLPAADWQWAMDPLDGTAAFARGLPIWGIGLGLLHGAEPKEGYLHFPCVRETYAFRDGVALRNGEPVDAPSHSVADDCLNIMITAVHAFIDVRDLAGFRLHNLGSNLYHMVALATGRCEAIITGPCYLWDLAPVLPFTRALGHTERYLDGSPLVVADLLKRSDFGFPVRQPLIIGPAATVSLILERISASPTRS